MNSAPVGREERGGKGEQGGGRRVSRWLGTCRTHGESLCCFRFLSFLFNAADCTFSAAFTHLLSFCNSFFFPWYHQRTCTDQNTHVPVRPLGLFICSHCKHTNMHTGNAGQLVPSRPSSLFILRDTKLPLIYSWLNPLKRDTCPIGLPVPPRLVWWLK